MAYALLNLGYPVIYKPFSSVLEEDGITTETFWEIFKDKASYDFRFVSHGLLDAVEDAEYDALCAKREAMEADLQLLKDIEKEAGIPEGQETFELDDMTACQAVFAKKKANGNFAKSTVYAVPFDSYSTAAGFATDQGGVKDKTAGVPGELAIVEASIADKDSKSITSGVINTVNQNDFLQIKWSMHPSQYRA
jgi:hypothetical protein